VRNASVPPAPATAPAISPRVRAGALGLTQRLARVVIPTGETWQLRREVLILALPAIGEQILTMLVGLVDTYLVGHLGPDALAAVGLANQVILLAMTVIMALATGTTALVARQVGAGDLHGARTTLQQSLLMVAPVGVGITVLLAVAARPALGFFQPEATVAVLGQQYLRVASLTFAFHAILTVGNAALRGSGDTRTPLYIMLLVNGVNVLLSYLLIHGWGPIPAWGVLGSAIGAAVARGIGGVVILGALSSPRRLLRFARAGWRPDLGLIKRVLNVGLPAGGEQLLMRFGQANFTRVVSGLGTAAYAAHQVAIQGQSLSFMPGMGFSVAATTLVGQGLGAGKPERARASVHECLGMAIAFMSIGGLVLLLLAAQVTALFVPHHPEVIALGAACNRLLGFGQPFIAIMMVLSGALRGAGDTRFTLVSTAGGVWLVRLPLAYLFVGPLGLGLVGAWYAMLLELGLRALVFTLRFRSGAWARIKV
jgi:putative MATE family efflux protein